MKTSAVLASLLFGSFAVAAPVDKRALVYKTEVVTATVVVYTTVWDDDVPAATSTSEGLFYEQPAAPTTSTVVKHHSSKAAPKPSVASSSSAVPTSSAVPAYTPPASVEEPSSVYTPPPQTPTTTTTPAPAPTTTTTPEPEAPAPTTTEPAYTAAPPSSTAAAPASTSGEGSDSAMQYTNVDITIYDNNGGFGACGTELHDSDMIVALAQSAWGASTYDVMTGAATNPWCGQKIKIAYEGNEIEATIMDLCPGCAGNDIDLSLAAWKALTGLDEKTRLKASWSKMD